MTDTATLVLQIVDQLGVAAWNSASGAGYDMLQATPPHVFGDQQPGEIPIRIRHSGPTIGHVDFLEETGNGLHAVAVIEGVPAELVDGCYCSPEILADTLSLRTGTGKGSRHIGSAFAHRAVLEGVALVDATAGVCAKKVQAWPGDYRRQDGLFNWSGAPTIIKRAKEAATWELRYRRPASVVIHRAQGPTSLNGLELRYGPPGRVLSVS